MRRTAVLLSVFLASILLVANMASAASYSLAQDQTVSGQLFDFEFDPVELSDGTDGILTIYAMGDYFAKSNESLDVVVDDAWGMYNITDDDVKILSGYDEVTKKWSDSVEWITYAGEWVIPGDILQSITADGTVVVEVDLYDGVQLIDPDSFVQVTLTYDAVPIPSAILLLGGGLLGMLGIRRRFNH